MSSGSSYKTSSLLNISDTFFKNLMLPDSSGSYAIKMKFDSNVRVLMWVVEGSEICNRLSLLNFITITLLESELYSEPFQTSAMEPFAKTNNRIQVLTLLLDDPS